MVYAFTMATSIQQLLKRGHVLGDGAMGTMLYDRGIFINRSYDELNLSQPDLVRSIHEEYLQAGAEIIETNTFGANLYRLRRHGLEDKLEAINQAGVRLARECVEYIREKQSTDAVVAGAVGPLGVAMAPVGKVSQDEAQEVFAQQIRALAQGGTDKQGNNYAGVDLILIETMTSVAEAEAAVNASRSVAPELPVIVLVTVDDEGNCLDGTSAEVAAQRLADVGADVIGANCSSGPATVLTVIERMRAVTALPLMAMPNAGLPQTVDGRNIYMSTPEFMASYARKFVRAGASLVGGCCGTTPSHIRAMKSALRAMESMEKGTAGESVVKAQVEVADAVQPPLLADRSLIGGRIARGEFVTLVEIVSPKGIDTTKEIEGAAMLHKMGVNAINVPDSPRASARMSAQSLCIQIQQKVGIETVLHYTCRDRNVLSIQSDLLGASSIGLKNVLCLTGDPPKLGNYPDATAVFDVDAIGLVNIVRNLNHGLDIG
ncbi:MAG TPA: bifunctional homocysteine S-methyltransferase/methylenetetrahydrofolate reductase, partial [Acidobacteriaceae bacterium]